MSTSIKRGASDDNDDDETQTAAATSTSVSTQLTIAPPTKRTRSARTQRGSTKASRRRGRAGRSDSDGDDDYIDKPRETRSSRTTRSSRDNNNNNEDDDDSDGKNQPANNAAETLSAPVKPDADLPVYCRPIRGLHSWQESRNMFERHVPREFNAKDLLEKVHADWLKVPSKSTDFGQIADLPQGPIILDLFMHYTEKQIFEVWRIQGSCTHRSTPAKRKAKMIEETGSSLLRFRARIRAAGKLGSLPEPDAALWRTGRLVSRTEPPAPDATLAERLDEIDGRAHDDGWVTEDDQHDGAGDGEEDENEEESEVDEEEENEESEIDDDERLKKDEVEQYDSGFDDLNMSEYESEIEEQGLQIHFSHPPTSSTRIHTDNSVDCTHSLGHGFDNGGVADIATRLAIDVDTKDHSMGLSLPNGDDPNADDGSDTSRGPSIWSVWTAHSWMNDRTHRHFHSSSVPALSSYRPQDSPTLPEFDPATDLPSEATSLSPEESQLEDVLWLDDSVLLREVEQWLAK